MIALHHSILKHIKLLCMAKNNDNYSSNWTSRSLEDHGRNACCQRIKRKGGENTRIISRELAKNKRIGFEFIDLARSDRSIVASITGNGPRVGKYFVSYFMKLLEAFYPILIVSE